MYPVLFNHVSYTTTTLFSTLRLVSPIAAYVTAINWWNSPNPTNNCIRTRNDSILLRSTTPEESLLPSTVPGILFVYPKAMRLFILIYFSSGFG